MLIKDNRSAAYVGTYDTSNKSDMDKLSELRKSVALLNKTDAFGTHRYTGTFRKMRVCARGRKPIIKSGPSYDWGGNIVGGLSNAGEFDVYIYERA